MNEPLSVWAALGRWSRKLGALPPQYLIDALESAPKAEPVAWMHVHHTTAYVITDRVKGIWLEVDSKHVEHYTIPLYTAAPINAIPREGQK